MDDTVRPPAPAAPEGTDRPMRLIPSHSAAGAAYGSLLGYGACLVVAAIAVRTGRADASGGAEPAR